MNVMAKTKRFLKKNPAKKSHRNVVDMFEDILRGRVNEPKAVTIPHKDFLKRTKRKRQFKKLDAEIISALAITRGLIIIFGRNVVIAKYDQHDAPLDLETDIQRAEIVETLAEHNKNAVLADTSHIEEPKAERRPQMGDPAGSIITGPGIILAFTATGFVFKDEVGALTEFGNHPLTWSDADESWVFVHPEETVKNPRNKPALRVPDKTIKPSERRAERKNRKGVGRRKR